MKTSLTIHASTGSLDNGHPLVYFSRPYLQNQNHSCLVCYENSNLFFPLAIEGDSAISLSGSPFGSIFIKDNLGLDEFLIFIDEIKKDLRKRGVEKLDIRHPPLFYLPFVNENWMLSAGFERVYSDVNQQISLTPRWEESIHVMQKRKLESLDAEHFEFRKMDVGELETAHKFVAVCRLAQNLKINIEYLRLKELSDATRAYDIFGVFREEKISSLCIAVRPTEKIAYYYLPATSPMFRNKSPMVLLIAGMVEYYRSLGFEYLDMGISSVKGEPQESLRIFKERMGAKESEKSTWTLEI